MTMMMIITKKINNNNDDNNNNDNDICDIRFEVKKGSWPRVSCDEDGAFLSKLVRATFMYCELQMRKLGLQRWTKP